MPEYPFEHDGPVYVLSTDTHNTFFYARDKRKFMLVHNLNSESYQHDFEEEIDNDYFWMMVAFTERKTHHAPY